MKAVVWHGIGDIRIDAVSEPRIQEPTDAVVRLTTSAIVAPICISFVAHLQGCGLARSLAMKASA